MDELTPEEQHTSDWIKAQYETMGWPEQELLAPEEISKFWSKVITGDDCWLWMGRLNSQGYGQMRVNGNTVRAHRLAWMIHYGAIDGGKMICHYCDPYMCKPRTFIYGNFKR